MKREMGEIPVATRRCCHRPQAQQPQQPQPRLSSAPVAWNRSAPGCSAASSIHSRTEIAIPRRRSHCPAPHRHRHRHSRPSPLSASSLSSSSASQPVVPSSSVSAVHDAGWKPAEAGGRAARRPAEPGLAARCRGVSGACRREHDAVQLVLLHGLPPRQPVRVERVRLGLAGGLHLHDVRPGQQQPPGLPRLLPERHARHHSERAHHQQHHLRHRASGQLHGQRQLPVPGVAQPGRRHLLLRRSHHLEQLPGATTARAAR